MTSIIIAVLGSGAFSAIVSAIISSISAKKQSKKALQLLMLDLVKRNGIELINKQWVSDEELRLFTESYECYKKLGGNGYTEVIKNKVNALPLKDELI